MIIIQPDFLTLFISRIIAYPPFVTLYKNAWRKVKMIEPIIFKGYTINFGSRFGTPFLGKLRVFIRAR
jgi:hypothetical protein